MSSKILPGEHQDSRPQNNQPIGSQELVELGLHYRAVPLADEGETLVLALSDLSDNRAIAAFRFATGKEIAIVHWENSRLQARLRELSAKPMLHELEQITGCSSSEGDRLRDEINIEGSRVAILYSFHGPLLSIQWRTKVLRRWDLPLLYATKSSVQYQWFDFSG